MLFTKESKMAKKGDSLVCVGLLGKNRDER